jgi:hypothetical protein
LQGVYRARCLWCINPSGEHAQFNSSRNIVQRHEKTDGHQTATAARKQKAASKARLASLFEQGANLKKQRIEQQSQDPALNTQMAAVFKTLKLGRPMTDYLAEREYLEFAQAPHIAAGHWSERGGWELAECMAQVELQHLKELVKAAEFLAVSLDEATAVDNTAWLSSHLYIIDNDFKRVPIFMGLSEVSAVSLGGLHVYSIPCHSLLSWIRTEGHTTRCIFAACRSRLHPQQKGLSACSRLGYLTSSQQQTLQGSWFQWGQMGQAS